MLAPSRHSALQAVHDVLGAVVLVTAANATAARI